MGSHYVFNLTYHPKVAELLTFIQENVTYIPTEIVGRPKEKLKNLLIKRDHMHLCPNLILTGLYEFTIALKKNDFQVIFIMTKTFL